MSEPLQRHAAWKRGLALAGALAGVLLLVGAYYAAVWGSVAQFVVAIDHCEKLFCDFADVYYPMGRKLLALKRPVNLYFYSAFFAVLLVPLGALRLTAALVAWGAVQTAATAGLCLVPLRQVPRMSVGGATLYFVVFATSLPILHNFKWGQVSVLLTLCMFGSLLLWRSGRPTWAGVLLAFAASIKYYPAILLFYYLIKGELRVLVAFAVAGVVLFVVVPAAVLGPHDWVQFQVDAMHNIVHDAEFTSVDIRSQYFPHAVMRVLHLVPTPALTWSLVLVGATVACANLWLIWVLKTKAAGTVRDDVLAVGILFCTLPFVLKTAWPHYFVFLPLCQAAALAQIWPQLQRPAGKALLAAVVLSMVFSSVFLFNLFPNPAAYYRRGVLLVSSSVLLAAIYGLIWLRPRAAGT